MRRQNRLSEVRSCPECGKPYRPFHKQQKTCGPICGHKVRLRSVKGNRFTALATAKARAALRAKVRRRVERLITSSASKVDAFLAGRRFGYERGSNAGYRRGYADGFSAGIGEEEKSA